MPPRRGRTTRRTVEESRAGSDDDVHQVENVTRQIGEMELVLARFQRTNPPTFAATEGGASAESCLVQMEELFETLEYAREKRLKLAVLQLRDNAELWWRGTSRILRDSGEVITWESFCEAFLLGNHGGSGSRLPARQRKNKNLGRETINTIK
ncbi:hypothetical protein F511_27058 [Dorcoceras hygrometricum]|uniref:Retrotransposon gag domain-containing protein n=1 Tax=Dorcoceras hygrometricum TaxID=472368 RepID=A0A2Z7D7I5_9LAMI|nr:hypothetical protein F511_27058 [Dorcoceras hygrometricum]